MKLSHGLFTSIILVATLHTIDAAAADESIAPAGSAAPATDQRAKPQVDVFVTAGARSMWAAMWGFIPMPPTFGVGVDINKLRIRIDGGYHPYAHLIYGMASGGMVFSPKGASASRTGGFQLKLPVLVDLGFMTGELEAGDGFRDNINWLLIGPSSGVDLIWWKANKLGIIVSFKLGIQARIDMNSSYADEPYSSHRDNYANLDTALTLGFII